MTLYELIKRKELKEGFTLPEMLIAMVVIGIVAAITIPAMIQKKDRRDWTTGLNKANAIVAEGFKEAEALHGSVRLWGDNFKDYLLSGFKILNKCEDNDCIAGLKYLDQTEAPISDTSESYILSDGQIMTLNIYDKNCTSFVGSLTGLCGAIYFDVNGEKQPNTWGKDYFGFYVSRDGIVPFGSQKIDVVVEGYNWVPGGCNDNTILCAKDFDCTNYAGNETVCKTCGGDWNVTRTDAYSEPVYAFHDNVISSSSAVASYRLDKHDATGGCQSYGCYSYTCNYYSGYTCRSSNCIGKHCTRDNYRAAYYTSSVATYQLVYNVDTPAYYTIESYNAIPETYSASCTGANPDSVCLGYKFNKEWDCWHDSEGQPYVDECNEDGNASKTSCDFKTVDALEDCTLDDKGTSCASWVIMNNNMIYLDGKTISW